MLATPSNRRHSLYLWIIGGLFFLGYSLLATQFTFWGDELISINFAKQPTGYFVNEYKSFPDNHPPIYYLILNVWQKIASIGYSNDYLFQLPSILFYSLTVIFITKFFLKSFQERLYFVLLTGCSSFFFMYSHMVRYYTLAALVFIVAFYTLQKWLRTDTVKWFWFTLVMSLSIAYVDYPSYIFYGVVVIVLAYKYKIWKTKKLSQILGFIGAQCLGILPLLYLNYIYFLQHPRNVDVQSYVSLKRIGIAVIGLGAELYQILIGEYFNLYITPLLIVVMLIIIGIIIRTFLHERRNESADMQNVSDMLVCIAVTACVATVFLTFVIGRYPIFSYARFLLPAGFMFSLVCVKLCLQRRWVIYMLIGINIFTLSMNIRQQDFINPIFFYPWRTTLSLAEHYQAPLLSEKNPLRPSSYLFNKFLSERTIYQNATTSLPQCFLVFTDNTRLRENAPEALDFPLADYPQVKVVFTNGYDNIAVSTKRALSQFGIMNTGYKYYYSMLKNNEFLNTPNHACES